jgi:WD40 repeat protein
MLQNTLTGHTSIVYEARWHPRRSGLLASVSGDCSLRIFDTKQSMPTIRHLAHPAEILSIDWSKYDDAWLITGACDNRIRLWDMRMLNKAVIVFDGHQAAVRRAKFDPYRRDRLLSSGYDGRIQLSMINSNHTPLTQHIEHVSKEFLYGLDWNLFESDQFAVGGWDRCVRLYQWHEYS